MNRLLNNCCLAILSLFLVACGMKSHGDGVGDESRQAKQLLQGLWSDEDTETPVFKMEGDSVYYPDSTSIPAYFKVVGDTLYIGSMARYFIEKHTEHLLWFRSPGGELVKLVKDEEQNAEDVFEKHQPQVLMLTEVLKRDTVINYDGQRYHLYFALNPTKYQVVRHTLNEDGLDVENIYYDNIIHLSIFQGSTQLFSSDFRKKRYQQQLSDGQLEQLVLNNMEFDKVDADGFHVVVSLCVPGDATCYLIGHVVSFDGKLSTKLLEY